jgi:hypothetical protein
MPAMAATFDTRPPLSAPSGRAGAGVSDRIRPRFISLHITEDRANESDELELVVSDHDGAVQLPAPATRSR